MVFKILLVFLVFVDFFFVDCFNCIDCFFSQLMGDMLVGILLVYDLQKVDDSNFLFSVSVSGWKDDELEIEIVGGNLYIFGKCQEIDVLIDSGECWIYKGICCVNFQFSFFFFEYV